MNLQDTMLLAIGGLGATELVIILVIVLLIFGAGKLPQIGDALGKSIKNFKKAAAGRDDKAVDVTPKSLESTKEAPQTVEIEHPAEETSKA